MTFRRAILLLHRYLGLFAAVFLAFAGLTGTLLAFRDPLDAMLNPDLFRVAPAAAPPPAIVMTRLRDAHPEWRIRRFALNSRPGESLRAVVAPHPGATPVEMFVDPATGHVIGTRDRAPGWDARHLMQGLHVTHYTLGCGKGGRWLMGGVAGLWLVLSVMGLYVPLPRRGPWLARWRPAWVTSRPAMARRPMIETHRVTGLWTLPVMLVLAWTSVSMNFFTEAFQPLANAIAPPRAGSPFGQRAPKRSGTHDAGRDAPGLVQRPVGRDGQRAAGAGDSRAPGRDVINTAGRGTGRDGDPAPAGIGYDAAERIAIGWAATARPGDAPVAMDDLPRQNLYGIAFAPGGTSRFVGLGRRTCYVDRTTGRIVWIDDPDLDGAGTMAIRSLYPLHTGQIAGLPGMVLDALMGIATAAMALSGVWPWVRRTLRRPRQPRISRRSTAPHRNIPPRPRPTPEV